MVIIFNSIISQTPQNTRVKTTGSTSEKLTSLSENRHLLPLTAGKIPANVTRIENGTFIKCEKLEKIIIPISVTNIGYYAFYYCRSLKSIEIPSGASIGDKSFYKCLDMTNLTISEGVTTIGIDAFNGCSKLTSVIIPSSVTTIKEGAFADCKNLDVVIDNSKENVDFASNAFNGCKSVTYLK